MIDSLNQYDLGETADERNVVYLGADICKNVIRVDAIDPKKAEEEDVVGYVHATPDEDGEYANDTIADGMHILCDGVMCQVGSSHYQDDGLAIAPIYRVAQE